ncbi:hypothetical protein BLNAU_20191 [Blattamonas nauphoetae]|uniref:Uncharacterized protein n=1 Tax=Blattamonas nauphoetae TaxID=2049346 RepID=A0ABQ9WZF1_9EUKA|nr:hypothetical protein BLNAU_20191 [Blattamonas nauphoetae]
MRLSSKTLSVSPHHETAPSRKVTTLAISPPFIHLRRALTIIKLCVASFSLPEDTTTTKLSVANSRALRDSAVCLDNSLKFTISNSATFTVSCIHWADLVSDDIVICSEHCCSNAGNIAQRENYRSASKNGWRMFQSIPTTKISSVRPLSSLICPCKAQTATMAQTNIVSPFVRIQRNCVVLTLSGRVLPPHDHILSPENPPDLMDSHR